LRSGTWKQFALLAIRHVEAVCSTCNQARGSSLFYLRSGTWKQFALLAIRHVEAVKYFITSAFIASS